MNRRFLLHAVVAMAVLSCAAILTIGCSDDDKSNNPVVPTETWAWSPVGTGTNDVVSVLQEYDGRLYAGGRFTEAGGVAANYIAVWNDTAWAPLGTGTSWPVYAMTIYQDQLIVGGSFGSAGGIAVNRVAAWDGASWSALGSGLAGDVVVHDLTVTRDSLFAVGSYGTGMNATPLVAVWDGSTWATIVSNDSGVVEAICSIENDILVGGYYIENASVYPYVQRRNTGTWYDFNYNTLPTMVQDLIYWDGHAVVAGSGDAPVKYFSAQWWPMGTETFGNTVYVPTVWDVCEFNGDLIAGGSFTTVGSTTVNSVASFDGTTWSALGSGIADGNGAYALAVHDSSLYIGGDFVMAGGDTVNNIAVWSQQ